MWFWSDFEKVVKEPDIPTVLKPGGIKIENPKDKKYIKELEEYATLRTHWIVLKSLQATPDIEWETVDITKPSTWCNYEKELKEADFTPIEVGRIVRGVMTANSLDEDMIDTARADFLAGREGVEK